MDELFRKAKRLEDQAQLILKKLELDAFFNNYGEVRPVGSMTYNLMTWEDIDLDLITEDTPNDKLFWKVANFLLKNQATKLLMLADNRTGLKEKNRPKSMYLGLKYINVDKVEWKIDIRLIERKEIQTLPDWMKSLNNLADKKRLAILRIKNQLKTNPNYHKSISSVDVYDAVINHEIDSIERFMSWWENNRKQ